MKRIPLTRGMVALVDDEDFIRFGKLRWFAQKAAAGLLPTFYAARRGKRQGTKPGKLLLLHREVMQAPPKIEVDHRFGNTLDCRKKYLRLVTSQQNSWNLAKTTKKTSSRFKGVCYVPQLNKTNPWIAYIGSASKVKTHTHRKYLGYFASQETAALAYDVAAKTFFGQYARLNFP